MAQKFWDRSLTLTPNLDSHSLLFAVLEILVRLSLPNDIDSDRNIDKRLDDPQNRMAIEQHDRKLLRAAWATFMRS
jgi:hypothetical protein